MGERVDAFEVRISEDALADLRTRLERTRFADDYANDDWSFGVPGSYLRALVDHWRSGGHLRMCSGTLARTPSG